MDETDPQTRWLDGFLSVICERLSAGLVVQSETVKVREQQRATPGGCDHDRFACAR
jgi:hypothetical protein